MTKEELILAAVERIEERQEQQRIRHEEFVSLLAAHTARITELEAGHGRHRQEHEKISGRVLTLLLGIIGTLITAVVALWTAAHP